jgi:hypothetical protein
MDLKEFIRASLTQIAEGVREAQEAVHSQGGFVNPSLYTSSRDESHFATMEDGQSVFLVDFDVAVTVIEEKGTNAEAKLKVASILALGGERKASANEEHSSRLRFKIPLALPVDPDAKQRLQAQRSRQQAQATALNDYDPYERERI